MNVFEKFLLEWGCEGEGLYTDGDPNVIPDANRILTQV